jgi:hypothetical protein
VPAAVSAPRRELRWGDAEGSSQPLNLVSGESRCLVAAAFGGANGRVTKPAHQFTDLCLDPAVLLAKDPDVRADNRCLVLRDLIDLAASAASRARLPDDAV